MANAQVPAPAGTTTLVCGDNVARDGVTEFIQSMAIRDPQTAQQVNVSALGLRVDGGNANFGFFGATPHRSGSTSQVCSITTVQTLVAANAQRLHLIVQNTSQLPLALIFASDGSGSATDYTLVVGAGDAYEFNHFVFTGQINGIWLTTPLQTTADSGVALVTEITA